MNVHITYPQDLGNWVITDNVRMKVRLFATTSKCHGEFGVSIWASHPRTIWQLKQQLIYNWWLAVTWSSLPEIWARIHRWGLTSGPNSNQLPCIWKQILCSSVANWAPPRWWTDEAATRGMHGASDACRGGRCIHARGGHTAGWTCDGPLGGAARAHSMRHGRMKFIFHVYGEFELFTHGKVGHWPTLVNLT
jgi:hypothetical protein